LGVVVLYASEGFEAACEEDDDEDEGALTGSVVSFPPAEDLRRVILVCD